MPSPNSQPSFPDRTVLKNTKRSQARKIAVLTVGRSDFGRYLAVLRRLRETPGISMRILASGGHFSPEFGLSIQEIENSGFDWEPGLEMMLASDTPASIGKSIGLGTLSLAQAFAVDRPDLLVVLGDRFEMLCGVNAALGFNIPVAHIHGGAVTEGAIDELVRHALTKMSHLHLVSCEQYAERVIQMGEEPWRVNLVGAPGLDVLPDLATLSVDDLSARTGLDLTRPTLLVCYHPVTLEVKRTGEQVENLLEALKGTGHQLILTYPNPDHGSRIVIDAFKAFAAAADHDRVSLFRNAGTGVYVSLLKVVSAMVGNSSSGIVEAPAFELPVVNIGTRQDGKVKARNVIDAGGAAADIAAAIERALSSPFRNSLEGMVNPYGDGHAGERIVDILKSVPIDDRLLRKKFVDR